MHVSKLLLLRRLLFIAVPLLALPLLFFGKELRCAYVILVMAVFWLFEVLPMGVVSLIPLFFFPFLEIASAKDVSRYYFKDNVVLFMCSLIMAMAVEESGLHRRIALFMLRIVGARRHSILIGLMLTTAFVSFFVSDTAATTLMLPIVISILSTLEEVKEGPTVTVTEKSSETTASWETSESEKPLEPHGLDLEGMSKSDRGFCKAMILATAHASLIGGTGVITGTGTNLVFREQMHIVYPDVEIVSYLQWMAMALPWVPLYLLASWLVLTVIFMPGDLVPKCFRKRDDAKKEAAGEMKEKIREAYRELGRMSFAEGSVMFWFIVLLLAWSSRKPGFTTGWGALLPKGYVADSTVAVAVSILMFIWPRSIVDPQLEPILGWEQMKTKYSWSCTLLIGSGFAISEGVVRSGLSNLLACKMHQLFLDMDAFWLQFLSTLTVCFMTEFASNIATAGIFVPIMLSLAKGLSLNPLYLVLPVTISCSFAFSLPIATPGNAVVYDTGLITMFDMISTGFFLNILCVWLTVANFNTYGFWLMGLDAIPSHVAEVSDLQCNNTSF